MSRLMGRSSSRVTSTPMVVTRRGARYVPSSNRNKIAISAYPTRLTIAPVVVLRVRCASGLTYASNAFSFAMKPIAMGGERGPTAPDPLNRRGSETSRKSVEASSKRRRKARASWKRG